MWFFFSMRHGGDSEWSWLDIEFCLSMTGGASVMVEGGDILEVIQDSVFGAEARLQSEEERKTTGDRQKRSLSAGWWLEMDTKEEAHNNHGSVLRSKFHLPWTSFRYPAWLNPTLAIRLSSHKMLVINSISQPKCLLHLTNRQHGHVNWQQSSIFHNNHIIILQNYEE